MKSRSLITFLCILFTFNYPSSFSYSAEGIAGQVLFNGQANTNFAVLLWRSGESDNQLSNGKKLTRIDLESDGSFKISPETKNFTIILVPSDENLKGPIVLHDFEDEKLSTKIVLSETPNSGYNIEFENQNNAISQFPISSFINVNSQILLKGSILIDDPTGNKVPVASTAGLPAYWSNEANDLNEKIRKLHDYALRNTLALFGQEHLLDLGRSLSLVSIPTDLLYISAVQINPSQDDRWIESGALDISSKILVQNLFFTNRIRALVSITNAQIDESLKKAAGIEKQQQIVWEKPVLTRITLTKDLLDLGLSSTSGLKVEIGSYTQNVCTVVGGKIRFSSIGACSLYVLQEGNSEYLPTPPFKIDFVVHKPVMKQATITCIKSKLIKKVTSISPKCPMGYKKK